MMDRNVPAGNKTGDRHYKRVEVKRVGTCRNTSRLDLHQPLCI